METFQVQHDCGCCHSNVQFENREKALTALSDAGIGNGKTITDDVGKVVTGVDTFYGLRSGNAPKVSALDQLLSTFF